MTDEIEITRKRVKWFILHVVADELTLNDTHAVWNLKNEDLKDFTGHKGDIPQRTLLELARTKVRDENNALRGRETNEDIQREKNIELTRLKIENLRLERELDEAKKWATPKKTKSGKEDENSLMRSRKLLEDAEEEVIAVKRSIKKVQVNLQESMDRVEEARKNLTESALACAREEMLICD